MVRDEPTRTLQCHNKVGIRGVGIVLREHASHHLDETKELLVELR